MNAVFLEKPGGRLVARETEIPKPGRGEVLVKISAAPVNPSDLAKIRNAVKSSDVETFIPGLEGSGRVVAAGKRLIAPSYAWQACSLFLPSSAWRNMG